LRHSGGESRGYFQPLFYYENVRQRIRAIHFESDRSGP